MRQLLSIDYQRVMSPPQCSAFVLRLKRDMKANFPNHSKFLSSLAVLASLTLTTAYADKDHKAKAKEARSGSTNAIEILDDQPKYRMVRIPSSEATTYNTVDLPLTNSQKQKFKRNLLKGILKPVEKRTVTVPVEVKHEDKVIDPATFDWDDAAVIYRADS